ncbi:MAG: nucleoid-associated protein [Cyclobacteriaceae bacterium]
MITIDRFVIHELVKEPRKTEASTIFSQSLGEIDDLSTKLVEEVHKTYNTSTTLKNTVFLDRNDRIFKNQIENYLNKNDNDSFYQFSEKSLKELENEIVKEAFASGGFYMYADYRLDSNRYIIVVLLRKRGGLNLKLVKGVYAVDPSENLNIDKIAMGFRLNYSIYSAVNDDRNYLALITNQQDKVSGYFKDWVVAGGVVSNETNTLNMIRIIKNIPLPLNENGEIYDRNQFQREVYDVINSSPSKRANLKVIGAHFYGEDNENRIIDYASKNDIQIDNDFKRSASIKNLITIKAAVKGIELRVDFDKLNQNEVDVKDNMVIIRDMGIIDQIIQQKKDADN